MSREDEIKNILLFTYKLSHKNKSQLSHKLKDPNFHSFLYLIFFSFPRLRLGWQILKLTLLMSSPSRWSSEASSSSTKTFSTSAKTEKISWRSRVKPSLSSERRASSATGSWKRWALWNLEMVQLKCCNVKCIDSYFWICDWARVLQRRLLPNHKFCNELVRSVRSSKFYKIMTVGLL